MKKLFLLLFASSFVACGAQETQFSKDARSQQLVTLDGGKDTFEKILKKHKGKTILIEVWASWCGDCVKAMPLLKETQAANPDVDYVFISMDRAADSWKAGIEKHDLQGDHYWAPEGMKGAFGQSIGLDWIPRYIIVDKKGKVVLYRAIEKDFEQINSTLKAIQI